MRKENGKKEKKPSSSKKLMARLDLLEDKYFFPDKHETKIAQWEVQELRQHRAWLWQKDEEEVKPDSDEIYGGVEGIANAINKEFPGATVHAVYVSDWMKGRRYPCTKLGVPPMPPPHRSGRHLRSLVFPWYREYAMPDKSASIEAADHRSRKEKADADLAVMAAEAERKRTSGLYVLTSEAEGVSSSIWSEVRGITQDMFERLLSEKLFVSGFELTPENVNRLGVELFEIWQSRSVLKLQEMLSQMKPESE